MGKYEISKAIVLNKIEIYMTGDHPAYLFAPQQYTAHQMNKNSTF